MNGSEVNQNRERSLAPQGAGEGAQEMRQATDLAVEAQDLTEREGFGPGEVGQAMVTELSNEAGGVEKSVEGNANGVAGGLGREQAVNFGNKVLTYNPDQVARQEQAIIRSNEAVRNMTEVENGLGKEAGENVPTVGLASAVQQAEREAWNKENLLNEVDPKRDREAQKVAHDQMEVAQIEMGKVERMTRGNFKILDLVVAMSNGRDEMMLNFENPRRLGDMNG